MYNGLGENDLCLDIYCILIHYVIMWLNKTSLVKICTVNPVQRVVFMQNKGKYLRMDHMFYIKGLNNWLFMTPYNKGTFYVVSILIFTSDKYPNVPDLVFVYILGWLHFCKDL